MSKLNLFEKAYANDVNYFQLSNTLIKQIYESINTPKEVLDLGSGKGELAEQLVLLGANVTAVDFSNEALVRANSNNNIKYIKSDIIDFLEKNDNLYDAVFIKLTIAFIEDKDLCIKLMLSNTKKYLVIITPILPKDRELTEKDKRISVDPDFFEPILDKYCYWEKSIIEKDLPVAIYTCKK